MRRTLAAVLATLLLTGCLPLLGAAAYTAESPVPVDAGWVGTGELVLHITPEVQEESPAFAEAVRWAAARYCAHGERCVKVVNGHGMHEVRMSGNSGEYNPCDATISPGQLACCDRRGLKRVIYLHRELGFNGATIVPGTEEQCTTRRKGGPFYVSARGLALHELGHWLGYDHVDDREAAMHGTLTCDAEGKRMPRPDDPR